MSEFNIQIPEFHAARGMAWLRERRCLLRGTAPGLLRHHLAGYEIVGDSLYCPSAIMGAAAEHCANVKRGTMLKVDVKRRISRSRLNGMPVVVKEYRRLHGWRCFSPDQRGWLGARRLHGSCHAIAWLRAKDASVAYLVMADAGDRDMIMTQEQASAPEAEALFSACGRMLASLHAAGIYHADCKASNFVFRQLDENSFRMGIIDCDDVRCGNISLSRRAKNIAQFLGVQWFITDFECRLALACKFIKEYVATIGNASVNIDAVLDRVCRHSDKIYPDQNEIMLKIIGELRGQA